MEEIEFSRWLFEGRPRQGKNVLPDGQNWLCYFAGSSKSHRENSISCIFLESSQVYMKNVVKCYKHFFGYFNALETNGEYVLYTYYNAIYYFFCSFTLRGGSRKCFPPSWLFLFISALFIDRSRHLISFSKDALTWPSENDETMNSQKGSTYSRVPNRRRVQIKV